MTDKISISGLDKVVLLRALWDKSKIASFFQYHPMIPIPIWNEEEAHKALRSYIDYFQGRGHQILVQLILEDRILAAILISFVKIR